MSSTKQYYLCFTDDKTQKEKQDDIFNATERITGKIRIRTHCPWFPRAHVGRDSKTFD